MPMPVPGEGGREQGGSNREKEEEGEASTWKAGLESVRLHALRC